MILVFFIRLISNAHLLNDVFVYRMASFACDRGGLESWGMTSSKWSSLQGAESLTF